MLIFDGEEYFLLICKDIIEMLYTDMYKFRNYLGIMVKLELKKYGRRLMRCLGNEGLTW